MSHKARTRNARPYGHGVTYCLDGKQPDKELPLRGRRTCRPLCGRQASGTPKVWHGAAVTEGVRQARIARSLLEFVQNSGFTHLLYVNKSARQKIGRLRGA